MLLLVGPPLRTKRLAMEHDSRATVFENPHQNLYFLVIQLMCRAYIEDNSAAVGSIVLHYPLIPRVEDGPRWGLPTHTMFEGGRTPLRGHRIIVLLRGRNLCPSFPLSL